MGYVETLMGKNEKIIIKTRQHWMVMAGSIVGNFMMAFVIIVIGVGLVLSGVAAPVALPVGLLGLVLLLIPAGLFIRDYLAWWNEEYMITNRRVVQAEGVMNKRVIDSSLEKVNDVVLNQKEALGSDEHFGPHGVVGQGDVPTMISELDELRKQGVLTEAEFQEKKTQLLSKM